MSAHTPRIDETDLLRMQVEASAYDLNELTRKADLLADLVEFHREQEHLLRERLRRAEEKLADQAEPVESGVEGVAA